MANLLDPLDARLTAILESALGSAGSGNAPSRYVPAGRFRRAADGQSLRDPSYPGAFFDRAYFPEYRELTDLPEPENPFDPIALRDVGFDLLVGYVYAVAQAGYVDVAAGTTETAAYSVQNVRNRALSEADSIYSALGCPEIFQNTASDPILWDCRRVGASRVEDLGGGRLLSVTRYLARLQKTQNTRYWPAQ